ncbi:MAG: hypothetical protein ACTHOD_02175 [Motilibacteraceae bacterium]
MDPAELMRALRGSARWEQLRGIVSFRSLSRAVEAGALRHPARGTYVLPTNPRHLDLAAAVGGVVSHGAAAELLGLHLVQAAPTTLTVPPHARRQPGAAALCYRALGHDEHADGVTSPLRTALDCARDLPLRDALAVGDGVLRERLVTPDELRSAAAGLRGPGSKRARQGVEHVDGRSANAFESAARAIALSVGLSLQPQLVVRHEGRFLGRADLGDEALGLLVECDSFAHHGSRQALDRDCRRYCEFVAAGWCVLRLSWEQVVHDADWVAHLLTRTVHLRAPASRRPAQARSGTGSRAAAPASPAAGAATRRPRAAPSRATAAITA